MVPDDLSIPRLLSQLEVDPQSDAIRLCIEAESLCRRHYFDKAVEAAQHAERIAREVFNSELQAITLLYLGAMYAARHAKEDKLYSRRSCGRAIRGLSLNRNYAIAQLIRAQIELQFEEKDDAIIHFYQTTQLLKKYIATANERQETEQVKLYKSLRDAANAAIGEIYGAFIEVQARLIAPKKKRVSGAQIAPTVEPPIATPTPSEFGGFPFDFPVQLDWPTTVELSPKNISITNQAALLPDQDADTIDYFDLAEISINGKPYAVESLYAISGSNIGTFRMCRDKEYVPVHIRAEEGKSKLSNSYLLIQKQEQPDRDTGVIVVENSRIPGARAFRYELDKPPLPLLRIIGTEREWSFQDDSEASTSEKHEPHIIGVAVAWLKPRS